jgi:hypothetical protein
VSSWDHKSVLGIAIHEIHHILGFSSSQIGSDFRDPNNGYAILPQSKVLKVQTVLYGAISRDVTKVITPTVVQVAREHFGCQDLDGVELEDGGSSGTAGSHWEKRILQNEFMTGTSRYL